MFLHSSRSEQLATLAGQANVADEATSELLSRIVIATGRRSSLPSQAASAARLRQLIEAGATHVDLFDFSALEPLNSRVNDLYEFSVWRKSSQFRDAPGLSKILPDAI